MTPDEAGDPHTLELETLVNGEQRQHSNTRQLIKNCFQIVAVLSTVLTLEPSDVISTGIPSGVEAAFDPPRYLFEGDIVRIEIAGIGAIESHVATDPDDTPRIG